MLNNTHQNDKITSQLISSNPVPCSCQGSTILTVTSRLTTL